MVQIVSNWIGGKYVTPSGGLHIDNIGKYVPLRLKRHAIPTLNPPQLDSHTTLLPCRGAGPATGEVIAKIPRYGTCNSENATASCSAF